MDATNQPFNSTEQMELLCRCRPTKRRHMFLQRLYIVPGRAVLLYVCSAHKQPNTRAIWPWTGAFWVNSAQMLPVAIHNWKAILKWIRQIEH